jgi:signal transduction histidine kinase
MQDPDRIFRRYQDLQAYVAWSDEDAARVRALFPLLEPHLPGLVEDFYSEIARHPDAHRVFTGGQAQVDRLKGALLAWLRDLLTGPYNRDYAARRWRVGARHVEIGLDQVYTNAALSRLRDGLVRHLGELWPGDRAGLVAAIRSLNKLLDLDLAKIEDAYQSEYVARLQNSERLASLGQIAGGITHEIRNPLNVIKSSLYYLKAARAPSPEKRAEHMDRIERNATLAEQVITTLTNFARMPVPEVRPFALRPSLLQALGDWAVPEGIAAEVDCPAELPAALADPAQIRIALGNLIRNACEAMSSGGRLTLRGRARGDGVEIDVIDTGVGIAPADLGRITEPLYSTKARGLGLGLALVRMILQKNGGSLQVTSEPGRGSTFTIRLGAAPEEDRPHE